jgi:hypothetical protein
MAGLRIGRGNKGFSNVFKDELRFREWRETYVVGAESAMGLQQAEDQSGAETVSRPETSNSETPLSDSFILRTFD